MTIRVYTTDGPADGLPFQSLGPAEQYLKAKGYEPRPKQPGEWVLLQTEEPGNLFASVRDEADLQPGDPPAKEFAEIGDPLPELPVKEKAPAKKAAAKKAPAKKVSKPALGKPLARTVELYERFKVELNNPSQVPCSPQLRKLLEAALAAYPGGLGAIFRGDPHKVDSGYVRIIAAILGDQLPAGKDAKSINRRLAQIQDASDSPGLAQYLADRMAELDALVEAAS